MPSKKSRQAPSVNRLAPQGAATSSDQPVRRTGALWGAQALLAVASLIAAYLAYVSISGGGVAGCGPDDGCGEVLNSRWSKWLGLPVSVPALGLYLGLMGLSWKAASSTAGAIQPWVPRAIRIGAGLVMGSALWFFVLSAGVLRKFCPYCFAVHLTAVSAALLLLKWVEGWTLPRLAWLKPEPVALAGLVFLIGGQLMFAPTEKQHVASLPTSTKTLAPVPTQTASVPSVNSPGSPASSGTPIGSPTISPTVVTPGPSKPSEAVPGQILTLYGDQFQLDASKLPLLGSPNAKHLMVSQFDYTCSHCRRTHVPISLVQSHFSNDLAVISLPMPLDGRCNEWVKRTSSHHTNGCQLAALALGVYRAAPGKFREYDNWAMHEEHAPGVREAYEYAKTLVGEEPLIKALADRWVLDTLQMSISLYRSNWLAGKSGSMPMMNVGTNIITGTVSTSAAMFGIVERSLGLKRNP